MVLVTLATTGSTKKNIVDVAFEECGILEYGADEAASALRKLNMQMQEWPFNQLGYAPGNSLDELTGFDPQWDQAAALSLALRLAPKDMNGSPLSADSKAALARSTALLRSYVATIPTGIIVSAPAGAGNRRFGLSPFIHES